MDPTAVLIIGIVVVVLTVVGIVLYVRMPKGKQGEVVVEPGAPFVLRCKPADARSYKLWVRYAMAWFEKKNDYGVSFDIHAEVGGRRCSSNASGWVA